MLPATQILIAEDKRRAPKPDPLRAPQRRRTEPTVRQSFAAISARQRKNENWSIRDDEPILATSGTLA